MAKKGRKPPHRRLPLARAISIVVEKAGTQVEYDRDVPKLLNLLSLSDQKHELRHHLWKLLKDAMRRTRDHASKTRTQLLPGIELYEAYPLDIDGERIVKRTGVLTRLEVERAIRIRRDQVTHDQTALANLERAYEAVKPIWDKNPALVFGEVCELYRKSGGMAA